MNSNEFTKMIDIAAERLGGEALACSDDFFAGMENLLKPGRGIFIPGKYTDRGKWMDGWESRRKRGPGHDWCIIRLATAGRIYGVDIDTNFFLGNHPPFASLEAAHLKESNGGDIATAVWVNILPESPLQPGAQNLFEISNEGVFTHVRLNIFPDGGVARLKVFGEVVKDWSGQPTGEKVDLAAAINGGKPILCNDMFFSHMDNLVMPGKGLNMGDGWETKRSRIPGNKDWVIVRLAHEGEIQKILIDTAHFKGNFPDSCMLEGCRIGRDNEIDFVKDDFEWTVILPQLKLQADHEHYFEQEILFFEPFTHVRLSIFPDGGISRMRLYGTPV